MSAALSAGSSERRTAWGDAAETSPVVLEAPSWASCRLPSPLDGERLLDAGRLLLLCQQASLQRSPMGPVCSLAGSLLSNGMHSTCHSST